MSSSLNDQDFADQIVARAIMGHPRPEAVARAIWRAGIGTIALLEGHETAAELSLAEFMRRRERAARAPRFAGTRR